MHILVIKVAITQDAAQRKKLPAHFAQHVRIAARNIYGVKYTTDTTTDTVQIH